MASVEGIRAVVKALRAARKRHVEGLSRGLRKGGLFLQRKSQELVPIDTGALRASAFTRFAPIADPIMVVIGYTQSYAIYVHEDLYARHAKGKFAKYLEWPARVYRREIAKIVREEMERTTK